MSCLSRLSCVSLHPIHAAILLLSHEDDGYTAL